MNTYYSNLIEGHNTRPREIEQALQGIKPEDDRRDLKIEAVAHYRVQQEIDEREAAGMLPDPASIEFIRYLHRAFYDGATVKMVTIVGNHHSFVMTPGEWRRGEEQDVEVGRHLPPASDRVPDFMAYFHQRFAFQPAPGEAMMAVGSSRSARLFAMATSHHRFNYIHPFPDGNGRVSRLMSHAMAQAAGVGAHGLWSVSRGLARGLAGGLKDAPNISSIWLGQTSHVRATAMNGATCRSRDWNCSPVGFCACVSISSNTWTACLTSKH
ncbi:filamentation induced by cAMP protein Fic (plasmid) [Agrobacterium tumefaciens]|nr:filamentation induced by cAMP protein Fic [Agrobacterium tumefaciens]